MEIVIDVSAILAVLLNEPERGEIIRVTKEALLISPSSLQWEIGNALSALVKRSSLTVTETLAVIDAFLTIPLRLVDIDLSEAVRIAGEEGIYVYDAYMIECAKSLRFPLLTLDKRLKEVAEKRNVALLEV
jgi:predicted nucleic acid-binding protein